MPLLFYLSFSLTFFLSRFQYYYAFSLLYLCLLVSLFSFSLVYFLCHFQYYYVFSLVYFLSHFQYYYVFSLIFSITLLSHFIHVLRLSHSVSILV